MNRSIKTVMIAAAAVLPLLAAVPANASENDNTFDSKAQCEKAIPAHNPGLQYNDDGDTFDGLKYCRMGLDRKWHINTF